MICYIDIHGTMMDFVKAVKEAGYTGAEHGEQFHNSHFWRNAGNRRSFYANAPMTMPAKTILEATSIITNRCFLTHIPSDRREMWLGTSRFIRDNIPSIPNIIVVENAEEKSRYAVGNNKPNVLVDDFYDNCLAFVNAGGIAFNLICLESDRRKKTERWSFRYMRKDYVAEVSLEGFVSTFRFLFGGSV